jgi:hypothetical protein
LPAIDINNDDLTFIVVVSPSNGSVSIDGSTANYTPNVDYNGTDSFTFKANDGLLDSNIATISATINSINDAPTVENITASIDTRNSSSINITLNANDVDGDSVTFSLSSQASNGTISLNNNVVQYTPNTDFEGTDSFTFTANDGTLSSNTGTVTITIDTEDAPTTNSVSSSTNEDTSVTIALDGSDVDGDNLTYTVVTNPSNGTASVSGANVIYQPSLNFNGSDSFTYKANDGTSDSNISTVSITVNAVNDAPIINDMGDSTNEDNNASWGFGQLIDTSIDIDGDNLTYSIVSNGSNGNASISFRSSDSEYIVTYAPN